MYILGLALRCDLKRICKLPKALMMFYLLKTVQEMAIPIIMIPINATPLPIPSNAAVLIKVRPANKDR